MSTVRWRRPARLLDVVSNYILLRKPDADQAAAAQVVFEIVRDALNFGATNGSRSSTMKPANARRSGLVQLRDCAARRAAAPEAQADARYSADRRRAVVFTKCDY